MGRIVYEVIKFDFEYLDDARETLGALLDIGVNEWKVPGDDLAQAFLASGVAEQFERRNPAYASGKSALDLLRLLAPYLDTERPAPEHAQVVPREDYWLGWILACYQMETGRPYRQVFDAIPYEELAGMFYPLHEAPEEKFVEALNHRLAAAQLPTRLYRQRKICGVSQKQLAEASGVGLRSIQLYEQRQKNINHAAAETLYRLAFALHCSMENLLER